MSPDLDASLSRLRAAVSGLEGAVERYLDVEGRRSELETELQVMQDDRSRLATDLESATAELARMGGTVDHVGDRLQAAIGTIETVLSRASAERPDDVRTRNPA